MKYIVVQVDFIDSMLKMDIPFVFPNALVHSDVAKSTCELLQKQFNGAGITVVAAGFINFVDGGFSCSGESISLGNVKSRGAIDATLIAMNDYGAGCHD